MMSDTDSDDRVFNAALDVTALVTEAGYGLLPREPTPAMLKAGIAVSGMGAAQLLLAYRAMHQAGVGASEAGAHDPIALAQKLLMAKKAH